VVACSDGHNAVGDGGTEASIGERFAAERGCPTCHTPAGAGTMSGDVTPVAGTMAFASNLTPDRTTGIGGWADEQIVRAIRYGIDADGASLCPAMPRYPTVGDVEAHALVAYLRSLPAVEREIPGSMCPPIKPVPTPDMATPSN
jgi:mono/diheme cytochrome c family protein